MTQDEFGEWLTYHTSYFIGMKGFLAKLPKPGHTGEGEPSKRDVLARWFGMLKDVTLEHAKEVTDSLASGEEEEPRGFDRHAMTVARIAKRKGRGRAQLPTRYYDGEPAYRCHLCQDDGRLIVWHPESMQLATPKHLARVEHREEDRISAIFLRKLGEPGTILSLAVRCNCEAGEPWRKSMKVKFAPEVMLPRKVSDEGEVDALISFVANLDEKRTTCEPKVGECEKITDQPELF